MRPRNAFVLGVILIYLGNLCQAREDARSPRSFQRLNAHWKDLVPLGLLLRKISVAGGGTFEFGNSSMKRARRQNLLAGLPPGMLSGPRLKLISHQPGATVHVSVLVLVSGTYTSSSR